MPANRDLDMEAIRHSITGIVEVEDLLVTSLTPPDLVLDEIEEEFLRSKIQHELASLMFNMITEHLITVARFIHHHRAEKEENGGT